MNWSDDIARPGRRHRPPRSRPAAPLLAVLAALLAAIPVAGRGAEPSPVPPDAAAKLAALRQTVDACAAARRTADRRAEVCEALGAAQGHQLSTCRDDLQATQAARAGLCAAISDLGRWVVEGDREPGSVGGCLTPDRRDQLAALLASWGRAQGALGALVDYDAGLGERPPPPPAGRTGAEGPLAALLEAESGRPPLLLRPIVVAALRRAAPSFWAELERRGRGAIDRWFASPAPLDASLLREARRGAGPSTERPGAAGPPLVASLSFVQSYLEIAGCPGRPAVADGDCRRARQLQELLESSGPLVVQRRVQSIWATDCRALEPRVLLRWLEDLPADRQRVDAAGWGQIADAGLTKLYTCYLGDPATGRSFGAWAERHYPGLQLLNGRALARLEALRHPWVDGGDEDRCARAVRALQELAPPATCALGSGATLALDAWLERPPRRDDLPLGPRLAACTTMLEALWQGREASVPRAFARPPAAADLVRIEEAPAAGAVRQLRRLCEQRRGRGADFLVQLRAIGAIAGRLQEEPQAPPWRVDPATGLPAEQLRFERAASLGAWAGDLVGGRSACDALGLDRTRCELCSSPGVTGLFDCELLRQLERLRSSRIAALWWSAAALLLAAALAAWLARVRAAWRTFGPWASRLRLHLVGAALPPRRDPWRWVSPSRLQLIAFALPAGQGWERWGRRAVACRAARGAHLAERDVHRAATAARAAEAEFALLVHDDGASPDLPAVRALLEWASRGSGRAVQVLPVAEDRLLAARGADDLLDLVEQTSLRGNPFEVRGRIVSSSQFFDRERLVSGLLGGVQAGHWLFVGGLRRFGKSSLALEVARRLPGPSAYVDLAGFYQELASGADPAAAADTILRYVAARLRESALARHGARITVPPPLPEGRLDGVAVAAWFGAFAAASAAAEGQRAPPLLIVLDEVEQAIGVAPARLAAALDVLAVLIGRLRSAFADPLPGGPRAGVILCGALHPLLWAPVPALAGQSLVGAFQGVFVPRLPEDAARAMMRGLGARQGIRFTEPALELIIREAHGIALLVRRLGSAVLELYDPERARQGSLGAVEVGIEGATAAVGREEEEGSPSRVWIESEIGDPQSPAGLLLRRLARDGKVTTDALRALAAELLARQFATTGIAALLPPGELDRRVGEAAATTVRMLAETGLLLPEGDLTSPAAYTFPDGIVRRVLARGRASPFAL